MDEIFRDFLVTFTIVSAIFGVIYVHYMTRHREKMSMLDRGIELTELFNKDTKWVTLKYGMFITGFAIGIIVGNILYTTYDLSNIASYLSMTFLFGGLSLILNFFIEQKYKK